MTDIDKWEKHRNTAEVVVLHDQFELEWKCRAAAEWLGQDPESWQLLIPLIVQIDCGRLYALDNKKMTPEELKSWREYMMSR